MDIELLLSPYFWAFVLIIALAWHAGTMLKRLHQKNLREAQDEKKGCHNKAD